MSLRGCLEVCLSPNTVSRFIRLFPKAAFLFLLIHLILMLITVIGYGKKSHTVPTTASPLPQEPVDDLGAIHVPKPVNWQIPAHSPKKNETVSLKKRKRKLVKYLNDEQKEEQQEEPFKLIED